MLTDATGAITDSYEYDAFGSIESRTGATANAYGYTGEYFDSTAGLQYNRARWYDAGVGRFISQDDFDGAQFKPATLNKYNYAQGDPVQGTDPSGYITLGEIGAGIDIQGTLINIARDQIFGYIQDRIFRWR